MLLRLPYLGQPGKSNLDPLAIPHYVYGAVSIRP